MKTYLYGFQHQLLQGRTSILSLREPVSFCLFVISVSNLSPSPSSLGQQTGWRALSVKTNQVPLYRLSQPIRVPRVCGWFSGFPSPNRSGLNKRRSLRVGGSPAQANSTWPWGTITPTQSVWHTHTHTHTHTLRPAKLFSLWPSTPFTRGVGSHPNNQWVILAKTHTRRRAHTHTHTQTNSQTCSVRNLLM